MAKTHKGIHHYTADEGVNIGLGQVGFKVLTSTGTIAAKSGANDSEWFVAFKVFGACSACATSLHGDHFTTNGSSTLSSSTDIGMSDGEMIWGAFDEVYATLGSGDYLIAYYG